LPSLDNNPNYIANSENNTTTKKPAEEKPKTGLAALFSKESTNKNKPTTTSTIINKDSKTASTAVASQAKKIEVANNNVTVQSNKESNPRKKSENIANINSAVIKIENVQHNNQEKKLVDQTPKGGLSALLNPDKNKQNKTPNKLPENEKPKEEAIKESIKTTPINANLNQNQDKIQESPLNFNMNKQSIAENINKNIEPETNEEDKAMQNNNANVLLKDKPKKIMILNKNKAQNNDNAINIPNSPNEKLININNKITNTDDGNIGKELEKLSIKPTLLNQNDEDIEFPNTSESNNYNYYQDDEFDRSKYSKDIPISNSNEYYRSDNNNTNNRRILNKRNPGENQMMKLSKNPSNDSNLNNSNNNVNNFSANNITNFDEQNPNIIFNNNNKFYQNNTNNNLNNNKNSNINNLNFNYQNKGNNPNMVKDQQMNKFNNFNKNNNNNDFNYNNRRNNNDNNSLNNNFDNNPNKQINFGNQKFNAQTQGNFQSLQAPFNIAPINQSIPNNKVINNYNTSLSFNYQHLPQMGGPPLNQYQNAPFEDKTLNPNNIKNLAAQQQAFMAQINLNPNQAAFYAQQEQILLQNQQNYSNINNKNFKANAQIPANAMNMIYNATAFQQGMYQQNMGFMNMANPLINQKAFTNNPMGGNIKNKSENMKGNNNN